MRIAVALLLTITLAGAGCAPRHPAGIMTWQEYQSRSIEWPYLLRIAGSRGELLYYGVGHTYSPDDPQIEDIERLWTEFRPDIAFNEGPGTLIESSRDEAVRKGGESAFVRFLAARDNVPFTTLDPSRSEETAHLKRRFPVEDVKLFFLLRAVAQHTNRAAEGSVDKEIERILGIFNASPGLMGPPRTLDEVAAAYRQRLPGRGEYNDAPMSWFDPVRTETFLNDISRESSEYRDRFMVEKLTTHLQEGHRVFAVVGGTHVVMQEPVLRRRLWLHSARHSCIARAAHLARQPLISRASRSSRARAARAQPELVHLVREALAWRTSRSSRARGARGPPEPLIRRTALVQCPKLSN